MLFEAKINLVPKLLLGNVSLLPSRSLGINE
jgi:hypothetical protein